jgi:hypothetical protein
LDTDNVGVNVYSNDEENFYLLKNGEKTNWLKSYNVASDDEETILFSLDDGRTLYSTLGNLIDDEKTNLNLKEFVDLGEATSTHLFSFCSESDLGNTNSSFVYLNVKSASEGNTSFRVRKWNVKIIEDGNTISTIGYTLGDVDSIAIDNIYYPNLSFTSTMSVQQVVSESIFNPMYLSTKTVEIPLNLEQVESAQTWHNVTAINYIQGINSVEIENATVELVKDSITFSYWVKENGTITKLTATVNDEGVVDGKYIIKSDSGFDYDTNILTVKFDEIKMNMDVVITYEYYHSLDINYTKPLTMNYKSKKSIKINEIGLEDENHELMAYMTFPDVEFHTIYDNLSAMFAINAS